MTFVRKFSAVDALKNEPLFEKLFNDITDGNKTRFVFPAIRKERIDFYWGGGKLFSYSKKNGFTTHHKYASVLCGAKNDYVSSEALQNCRLIASFEEGYERIKENCEKYSGVEALGVSSLYERFSYANKENQKVVVLDIEAAFSNGDSNNSRIDMVIYDSEAKTIRFVEAKHFSNKELRAKDPQNIPVINQLKQYQKQIIKSKVKILSEYKKYIKTVNKIFSLNLPEPEEIDHSPILLIFGFDDEQRKYLEKTIIEKLKAKEIDLRIYCVGNVKKSDIANVFRGGKQNF